MQPTLSYASIKSSSLSPWPWVMLPARALLFVGVQALVAFGFYLAGSTAAWEASATW